MTKFNLTLIENTKYGWFRDFLTYSVIFLTNRLDKAKKDAWRILLGSGHTHLCCLTNAVIKRACVWAGKRKQQETMRAVIVGGENWDGGVIPNFLKWNLCVIWVIAQNENWCLCQVATIFLLIILNWEAVVFMWLPFFLLSKMKYRELKYQLKPEHWRLLI